MHTVGWMGAFSSVDWNLWIGTNVRRAVCQAAHACEAAPSNEVETFDRKTVNMFRAVVGTLGTHADMLQCFSFIVRRWSGPPLYTYD
jgi:hypothetical protein